jgi:hypothetical protein
VRLSDRRDFKTFQHQRLFASEYNSGTPRNRRVDNIKMNLREIGWDGINWIDLAEDRDQWRALVNTVMNLRVP